MKKQYPMTNTIGNDTSGLHTASPGESASSPGLLTHDKTNAEPSSENSKSNAANNPPGLLIQTSVLTM